MSFDDSPPIEISSRETSNDNIDNLEDDDAFNHYHENGINSIEDNMLPDLQKYQSTNQDEDLFSTYESLKVRFMKLLRCRRLEILDLDFADNENFKFQLIYSIFYNLIQGKIL